MKNRKKKEKRPKKSGPIDGAPLLLRFNNVQQGFYIVQTKLSSKFQGFYESFVSISKIQTPIRPKIQKILRNKVPISGTIEL